MVPCGQRRRRADGRRETGASSGIGEAIARGWAKWGGRFFRPQRTKRRGARAGCAGRSRPEGVPSCSSSDVTREEDRARLIERACSETGRIDVLENNAGRGDMGAWRASTARARSALRAQHDSACRLTCSSRLDFASARAGGHGRHDVVGGGRGRGAAAGSSCGQASLPWRRCRWRCEPSSRTGVRVVVVRPGPVDTPFRRRAITTDGSAGVRPRGAEVQSPDDVAEQTIRAIDRGQSVVETTGFVRAASAAARLAPGAMRWISAVMASRAGE